MTTARIGYYNQQTWQRRDGRVASKTLAAIQDHSSPLRGERLCPTPRLAHLSCKMSVGHSHSAHNDHRAYRNLQDVAPEDGPFAGAKGLGEINVGLPFDAFLHA
jgi:hypothetical protein